MKYRLLDSAEILVKSSDTFSSSICDYEHVVQSDASLGPWVPLYDYMVGKPASHFQQPWPTNETGSYLVFRRKLYGWDRILRTILPFCYDKPTLPVRTTNEKL